MPKSLYTYCCRLCLHDGSLHELLDIFSVEGLGPKILRIFNIKVSPQDSCTTNICLTCFNEALTLDRQMQLFKQQKQTILNNQERFKKSSAPDTTAVSHTVQAVQASSEANVTQNLPVDVSTISPQAQQTAPDASIRDKGAKRSTSSPKTIVKKKYDKTNNQRDGSKKANDKKKYTHSSTKAASSKAKASGDTPKSRSKTPQSSSSAGKRSQPTVLPAKTSGGKSQTPYVLDCSNVHHSADEKTASNSAKLTTAATGVKPKKAPNHDVPVRTVASEAVKHVKKVVVPVANSAEKTNITVNDANQNVQNEPTAVEQSEQPDGENAATQVSNNGLQLVDAQKDTLHQVSTITEDLVNRPPTIVCSDAVVPVAQTDGQSVSSLGAKFKPTFTPLQGGLCSIPLANIPRTVYQNESRAVVVSSTANLTAAGTTTCVPATESQLGPALVASNAPVSEAAPVENQAASTASNIVSPGTIKKRRHSTYIRVSSNLFDEPPEKAQFAMLNNNLFIRNVQTNEVPPQTNVPTTVTYSCLPVLPRGLRVQAVVNPQVTMPFNSSVNNQYAAMNGRVQTTQHPNIAISQRPFNLTQPVVTNNSNFGITAGANHLPRMVGTSTIIRQLPTVSATVQKATVVPNSNTSNNCTGLANNSHLIPNINGNNANHFSISPSTQPLRPCFRCNLCSTYYLLEYNLDAHMQRIHEVEKNEQNVSKIYDSAIIEKLMARYRRKSIADPSLLSGNRT